MAHPNETVVRELYAAFERRDNETIKNLLNENVVLHVPGHSQMSGDYRGRDTVIKRWDKQVELLKGRPYHAEDYDLAVTDKHVIWLANVTAERDGKTFEYRTANVFRMQAGKIIEIWTHIFDLYAWDEFWGS